MAGALCGKLAKVFDDPSPGDMGDMARDTDEASLFTLRLPREDLRIGMPLAGALLSLASRTAFSSACVGSCSELVMNQRGEHIETGMDRVNYRLTSSSIWLVLNSKWRRLI